MVGALLAGSSAEYGVERKHLWREGFVRLPGLVPAAELAPARGHIINATRAAAARCALCDSADDLGDTACLGCARTASTPASFPKSFIRAKNLHRGSAGSSSSSAAAAAEDESAQLRAVRSLVLSPRLAHAAAQLLGCTGGASRGGVRLYQDVAFLKEAGDTESAWHQDGAASPVKGWGLALWLALDEVTPEMGPLLFARRSHKERYAPGAGKGGGKHGKRGKRGKGGKGGKGGKRRRWWEKRSAADMLGVRGLPLAQRVANVRHLQDDEVRARYNVSDEDGGGGGGGGGGAACVAPALAAGDATAHLSWTLHKARPNLGSAPRAALSISYFCDGDTVHRDMLADPGSGAKGVPLHASDGPGIVVQLLNDDAATWVPWILSRQISPMAPLANDFTPLLWPSTK